MDEVPDSLDATVAALDTWYETVIPPGQQAAIQLYENVRATSHLQDEDGHVMCESFIAWAFRLFNLTLAGNYMITYTDELGTHTGYDAIQRSHDAHALENGHALRAASCAGRQRRCWRWRWWQWRGSQMR